MAFWITYDHLGKFLLIGLIWSLALLLPGWIAFVGLSNDDPAIRTLIGAPATAFAFGIVLPIPSVGLAHMVKVLIDERDGSVSDFFRGIRQHALRAVAIGILFVFAVASLATSTWFYAAKLGETAPLLGYAISGLALWCLLFAALIAMFVLPALVQKKGGIWETLRLAALLVLDNPLFSLGLAFQVLVLTALCLAIFPLFIFIYGPGVAALTGSAYEMLARKYAAKAAETGTVPANQPLYPPDEEDDYLNRGFRDFLFPWKG
ncbi:MAG: hypothetical protein U9Q79_09040 [Candidatus Hydrogenedentes bacterium]|nr:hypothetical protein [Candidatus Hydrogenedentota bacterium]